MIDIRRMLYETTDAGPFWSNYLAGYLDVSVFGQVYITDRGQEYLDDLDGVTRNPEK
jgi:hypothetical protein